VWLLAVALAGWGFAELFDLHDLADARWYAVLTSVLLTVGLYGATYGIDLGQAREHKRVIFLAVTVGVLCKAALIGGTLYLATRDPLFLLLGVAVAQIDPLSVASIMGDRRMSPRAKTILNAWASFDDPITVILLVYAAALATGAFGLVDQTASASGSAPETAGSGLLSYALVLGWNLLLAGVAVVSWRLLRRRPWLAAVVLAALAVVAVWQFLMLAVAIVGLFVRPAAVERHIGRITQVALFVAGAVLGTLLVAGIDLGYGLLLGLLAFGAQAVAALLLTRGMSRLDRTHLALAQQNGITAIILGLRLETQYGGAVAVIAPAILVTNLVHLVANRLADRRRPALTTNPDPALSSVPEP
jgi:hypothetical protein